MGQAHEAVDASYSGTDLTVAFNAEFLVDGLEAMVGDEVVLSCGQWDENAPDILAGADPITSLSNKIWGYEENWGSFAQYALIVSRST